MAGKIIIDPEKCKGCGLCVQACPNNVIAITDSTNSMGYFFAQPCNPGCTGCAICGLICPDVAITVFRDDPKKVASESKK